METSASSDAELLAAWVAQRREPAFRALVSRYATLVHMAAKRTCGDDSLAADASQLVFILLAQKAKSLTAHPSIAGWLQVAAVMKTRDLMDKTRRESRKRQHFRASMDPPLNSVPGDAWQEMQPVLDDALASLSAKDREALLLRFYRSLSVREIAATLGIATDAAQKRLDRATERLRGKLVRRGMRAGASFTSVMIAGFAADAQAVVLPVSVLASKATAAVAVSSGLVPTTASFVSAASTKTSAIVAQLVAVLVAGAWVAGQRLSIAALEVQSAGLRKSLAAPTTAPGNSKRDSPRKTALDSKPVDWNEVARQLSTSREAAGYLRTTMRLEEKFLMMTREELIAALDDIVAAELSPNYRETLECALVDPLVEKDPEYVVRRFSDRIDHPICRSLFRALRLWTGSEPEQAVAWLDGEIAAGKLDSKAVTGYNPERIKLESALTSVLLTIDPAATHRRVAAIPESQRLELVGGESFREIWAGGKPSLELANLLRAQLPEKDHLNAISWPVIESGEGWTIQYPVLDNYLNGIEATPAERDACILRMARKATFPRRNDSVSEVTSQDLDGLRAWVRTQAPELVDRATGEALVGLLSVSRHHLVLPLAIHCHEMSGNDEVLLPLLERHGTADDREMALTLAPKLADENRRYEILGKLK